MTTMKINLVFLVYVLVLDIRASKMYKKPVEDFQLCIDAKHHKPYPSPESSLKKCDAWKSLSCCTNDTADKVTIDGSHLYNFNYSHCAPMSRNCLDRFELNHCFYECSPNVGPWKVAVNSSFRNETFHNVPLCKSECNAWWSNCLNESTCVSDWSHGFNWTKGANYCPNGSECRSFKEVFHNATYFCEHVFGPYDYKVASSDSECMHFSFGQPNPNTEVARKFSKPKSKPVSNDDTVPLYVPPPDVPPLQVHGTIASVTIAIIILIAVCGVLIYYGVRRFNRGRFWHQGVPVRLPSIVRKRMSRRPPEDSRSDAEMSFMQYEEEEEDDEAPGLNGGLQLNL